jgi:hypothetical protein
MYEPPGWVDMFASFLLWPLLWSVAWKAVALWKAARRNQLVWYVILAIIITAGILEIIYIFAVAKGRDDGSAMATADSAAR